MKSRLFDHIDLRVTNLEAADAFYSVVLPAIGFPKRHVEADSIAYDSSRDHSKPEFISLIEDTEHVRNKTRIAFWCDTREEVDQVAAVLPGAKALNVEGPMFNPDYGADYYAVFFEDPCGNRLEVCCRVAKTNDA
jgi:catechol 2,3-dioxygenase-like lactoylglutathione lyase family enzyme